MIRHKGYTGVFEFDGEIDTFSGHVIGTRDQLYFEGTSLDELKESMVNVVDLYLETCEEHGKNPDKPFTGQLRVRMDAEIHRAAAIAASASGQSLNAYIIQAITEKKETQKALR